MGQWQEAAAQYFPEADIQSPSELYIAAGTQLAKRSLLVEVSIAPRTYSGADLETPGSTQSAVIEAAGNVKDEIIDTVGYRLGYRAMLEDARNNNDIGLSRLLHDPREDYKPNAFQQTWASVFNQEPSPKITIK